MTTSITDPPRQRGPLTERILQLASRKGMYQAHLAQLAGMSKQRWERRVRHDSWTYEEVCDIATALNERVDVVLNVTDTL